MTKSTRATDPNYPILTGPALVTLQRWVDGLQPFYQSVRETSAADESSDERKVPLRRPAVSARRLHPGNAAARR